MRRNKLIILLCLFRIEYLISLLQVHLEDKMEMPAIAEKGDLVTLLATPEGFPEGPPESCDWSSQNHIFQVAKLSFKTFVYLVYSSHNSSSSSCNVCIDSNYQDHFWQIYSN